MTSDEKCLVLFLGLAALWILAAGLRARFIAHLKRADPVVWETLGKPGPVPVSTVSNGIGVLTYLLTRGYLATKDAALIRSAVHYKMSLLIFFVYFIVVGFIFTALVDFHK
jgi:hypothetical protein